MADVDARGIEGQTPHLDRLRATVAELDALKAEVERLSTYDKEQHAIEVRAATDALNAAGVGPQGMGLARVALVIRERDALRAEVEASQQVLTRTLGDVVSLRAQLAEARGYVEALLHAAYSWSDGKGGGVFPAADAARAWLKGGGK